MSYYAFRLNPVHHFTTIEHTILNVIDSRSKMALSLFFSDIPREERKNVKYVTIDMGKP